MKKFNSIIVCGVLALAAMSCENPMTFRTKVNEDGSLEKTIVLEKAEDHLASRNVFGISEKNGWTLERTKAYDSARNKSDKEKFRFQFSKYFDNDAKMNEELDKNSDTLFRVHAKLEKDFRWFYTYLRYSETIRPANRFKLVAARDFFTQEDDSFIQRLPADGKSISKADSVYLLLLNEKIFEHFATMGIFKETYKIIEAVVVGNSLERKWLDTLAKNKDLIYKLVEKNKGEDDLIGKIVDTLKIPLPHEKAERAYNDLSRDFNSRLAFMSFVRDGKYRNEFQMPWTVVTSNADSVVGNNLYWKPVVDKFVYMDYEMFAESRKLNGWAVAISILIIGFTAYAWGGYFRVKN